MKTIGRNILILSVLFLAACGDEEAQENSLASSDIPDGYRSLYVAKDADLPECNETTESWLAYVKSTKSFRACLAGIWEIVEAKGKDGEDGVAGEKGEQGDQGLPGEDGEDVTKIVDLGDTFIDPDTGVEWTWMSEGANYADAVNICAAEGLILPSASFSYKFQYYYFPYIGTMSDADAFWTDVVSASGHESRQLVSVGGTIFDSADIDLNYVICVTP